MAAVRWKLLRFFAALVGLCHAQTDAITPWTDVCTSEDFVNYRSQLCPVTFVVSTLAFNPLYPGAISDITILLQPSEDLPSSIQRTQYIDINLAGFEAIGTTNVANAILRDLQITAGNTVPLGFDPLFGYNTQTNPLFTEPALYNLRTRLLRLTVRSGQSMLANRDTEITICCMRLPSASPKDFPGYTISGPTSLDQVTTIVEEPILNTPEIDPGLQWEFLRVSFDPPISRHVTVIHLTLRPANSLTDRARIILSMPTVERVNNVSGSVSFNTASSVDGADWMFFESAALWDHLQGRLTFFLRAGKVLAAGRQVTLSTEPGEFQLPIELPADSDTLTVSARSFDDIDEVVRETPVTQSSAVPHVRNFTFTRLAYTNNVPNQQSNVMFHFMTNRPLFAGSVIFLRLSGFTAQRVEVPLKGTSKAHFRDESAYFKLPENILELHIARTIYSDEYLFEMEFVELILPPALYANDSSLLAWNSDPGAPPQPVDDSPMVGAGYKTFKRSQLVFLPLEPRLPANISFTLEPSISFYQGDSIVIHMYGFACTSSVIPLLGPDAYRVQDQAASWTQQDSMLVFTTAANEIISNAAPFRVSIGRETNFRLPDKLSENDGILRIEGRGALIDLEPVKKIPKIGEDKYVIESRVEFDPEDVSVNAFTRISFSMVLNTDVLPNSTIYIKLGGLIRDPGRQNLVGVQGAARSGTIKISGANGPLFRGEVGYWDQDLVLLTVQMISTVQIYAGERVRFFIERDQDFKLPFSAYPNDPSFRLAVPEAGIPERPFKFSTRVSQQGKQFAVSEIFYGSRGAVAYPNTVVEFNFRFQPNVNLPAGTTVRLSLPGFTCPFTSVPIGTQEVPVLNEKDLSDFIRFGQWDQLSNTFDLVVPVGQSIYRQLITVLRIMESGGFRLPSTPLLPDDMRLTIQAIGNVVIFEEPIKTSPRVVDRSFQVSEFVYSPPQKDSIFQLRMILQPTVNITEDNDIIIFLPGFRNSLSKVNIHIMGDDRYRIENSMGYWNETTAQLRLTVPRREVIPAFSMLNLVIEESQGFILPAALNANDASIRISSVNNIQEEPIKTSPMVGNGPFAGHLFCMYQYEIGTRSPSPICSTAIDCNPPLTDPCNPTELLRCGCDARVDEVFPMSVLGFNLQQEDSVHFLPENQLCSFNLIGPTILNAFSEPLSQAVSEGRDQVTYEGMTSISTGIYRVCANHVGRLYDVGMVIVRPSCPVPLVLVDGACVEHCPRTKVPIAGKCVRDNMAFHAIDTQDFMLAIRMTDPYESSGTPIASRSSDDAEQRYFIYRYVYEMGKILNADPTRIQVASLSNGSVVVNTVFKVVGSWNDIKSTDERSPWGLISLLKALQADTSSQLYQSPFFKYIDRAAMPEPLPVRQCPDGVYRVFCPYTGGIMSTGEALGILFLGIAIVPVALSCLCCALWYIDLDKSSAVDVEDVVEKLQEDPNQVDPKLQIEYASSWLEGRFMGEEWQKQRQVIASIAYS
ncbi:unnamed protein product [Effrenium voratum]|nr:unnamed protein product [Effrenium voratum]|mmetsp:Transcript_79871/g.191780  ORF Transcript_79871/g.191780 Transcript_79871/m.191780 type:complete len:1487 (+) Transcript_79871:78-4538(+)